MESFTCGRRHARHIFCGARRRQRDRARQIPGDDRGLQRLPHARFLPRQAGFVAHARRFGSRVCDPWAWGLPRTEPDARQGNGVGRLDRRQIISAITAGTTPEGRRLAPIMPYEALSHLTSDDAHAIVAYLRSLPPVKNKVPGPFGPKETPTTLVFVIVPGAVYAKMPPPP